MKDILNNRKARFLYEVLEEYEAGIILTGNEVKSIREGYSTIIDAFIFFKKDELYIKNMVIAPYKKNHPSSKHIDNREKKILLKKREIVKIRKSLETKGITCIPLSFYNRNNKIKVKVGVCKGKNEYDKRNSIKKRDQEREINNYA